MSEQTTGDVPRCGASRDAWGGGRVECVLPAGHDEHHAVSGARWTDRGVDRLCLATQIRQLVNQFGQPAVAAEIARQTFGLRGDL